MPQPSSDPKQVARFRAAYQELVDEIRGVPASDSIAIEIDIAAAVTTLLGALPKIRALRSRVVAELPQFDIERFDKLETYALAAAHAHGLYLAASEPCDALDQLADGAAALREILLDDAMALARDGIIDGERLNQLKGVRLFRSLAFDLFALAAMMREVWPKIAGQTSLQLSELDQAETLADRILTAIGQREEAPAVVAASFESRQGAFSLFVAAYEHARQALTSLGDEVHPDDLTPSLHVGVHPATRNRERESLPRISVPPLQLSDGAIVAAPIFGIGLPECGPLIV